MPHSLYYKLTHHWTIDDHGNRVGFSIAALVAMCGIAAISLCPITFEAREERIREIVRKKEDDHVPDGDDIRLFKTGLAKYLNSEEYKDKQKRRAIREKELRYHRAKIAELEITLN